MSVESDDDRLIFLSPDEFGGEATYAPKNGAEPYTIVGTFDDEHTSFNPDRWPGHEYQMQQGAHFGSTGPRFLCRSVDLVRGGKKGDRLTIHGTTYHVTEPQPDGTGLVTLILMVDD